jgi:hypothetical protein
MKIALFSSATDENQDIFVGYLADENTGHATVFSSAIWPTKIMGSYLKKTAVFSS